MSESHNNFFKFFATKILLKIDGEPDYFQLKTLKDHLKANATRFPSDLGGGAHGHLGLVLSPVEYATLSATPYNQPGHPGPLVIPLRTTQHASSVPQDQHKKALVLFHETIDLKNALKNQITDCIDETYYRDILD